MSPPTPINSGITHSSPRSRTTADHASRFTFHVSRPPSPVPHLQPFVFRLPSPVSCLLSPTPMSSATAAGECINAPKRARTRLNALKKNEPHNAQNQSPKLCHLPSATHHAHRLRPRPRVGRLPRRPKLIRSTFNVQCSIQCSSSPTLTTLPPK